MYTSSAKCGHPQNSRSLKAASAGSEYVLCTHHTSPRPNAAVQVAVTNFGCLHVPGETRT